MFDAETPAAIATLHGVRLEVGGRTILGGVDLSVPAAGVTALMGPNGAGKSLTLRIVAGLVTPSAGEVRWSDAEGASTASTALVFQRPILLRRSVAANLDHAVSLARVPRRERARRRDELLDMCGLRGLADRPARALSGGEAQRVAMARALAFRPRLLLLDEPTASLDPRSTAAIEELIRRAAADGAAALLVTHDAGQARRLADRVAFMHAGLVVEQGSARRLDAPQSEPARAYLAGRLLL